MKPIPTGRAECGTTYRSSLGNGTGEQAHIDRAPKGRRSADPAQQSVFQRKARGRRGTVLDRLYWKRLEFMSPLAQEAWRQAHQVRETAGERAHAGITNLETNIGHAERSRQQQPPGHLEAQRGKKFTRRNANQATKDAMAHILATCKKHGVAAGLHTFSGEEARTCIEEGWQFVAVSSELKMMLNSAAAELQKLRA